MYEGKSSITSLSYSEKYKLIGIGYQNGFVKLFDVLGKKILELGSLSNILKPVTILQFIDVSSIFVFSSDSNMRVWDINKESLLKSYNFSPTVSIYDENTNFLFCGTAKGKKYAKK
jgi:WD40 repeat protein